MYPRILQRFDEFLVKTIDRYVNFRWYCSPLTKKVHAPKEIYLQIAEKAKSLQYPVIDEFEKEYGFKIDQEWYHQLALHTQVVIKKSDICYVHGRLLYACLRNYIVKNDPFFVNILETGTARGFSAICMAKALEDSNIEGKIITFDVLPHNTKMYWNCIDDCEEKKTRAELLAGYCVYTHRYLIIHQGNTRIELEKLHLDRIHFAFLDGAHDYGDVMFEFNYIRHRQMKGDIIFFDDYTPSLFPGIVKAVDEICGKHEYSKKVIKAEPERAYIIAEKQ